MYIANVLHSDNIEGNMSILLSAKYTLVLRDRASKSSKVSSFTK